MRVMPLNLQVDVNLDSETFTGNDGSDGDPSLGGALRFTKSETSGGGASIDFSTAVDKWRIPKDQISVRI